jgi:HEAT repeat protein
MSSLPNHQGNTRKIIVEILGEADDIRIIEPLINVALSESDEEITQAIITVLKRYENTDIRITEFLENISFENQYITKLQDSNANIRREAAHYLGKNKILEAVEPLIKSLRDEDRWVRIAAIEALDKMGDIRAVPHLIEMLSNIDLSVQRKSLYALEKMGTPEALEAAKEYRITENIDDDLVA